MNNGSNYVHRHRQTNIGRPGNIVKHKELFQLKLNRVSVSESDRLTIERFDCGQIMSSRASVGTNCYGILIRMG